MRAGRVAMIVIGLFLVSEFPFGAVWELPFSTFPFCQKAAKSGSMGFFKSHICETSHYQDDLAPILNGIFVNKS